MLDEKISWRLKGLEGLYLPSRHGNGGWRFLLGSLVFVRRHPVMVIRWRLVLRREFGVSGVINREIYRSTDWRARRMED